MLLLMAVVRGSHHDVDAGLSLYTMVAWLGALGGCTVYWLYGQRPPAALPVLGPAAGVRLNMAVPVTARPNLLGVLAGDLQG